MKPLAELKVNGVPITVVSEEDAEQCHFVACVDVASHPNVPSPNAIKDECFNCKQPIWFNQKTSPREPRKVCMVCLINIVSKDPRPEFFKAASQPGDKRTA